MLKGVLFTFNDVLLVHIEPWWKQVKLPRQSELRDLKAGVAVMRGRRANRSARTKVFEHIH